MKIGIIGLGYWGPNIVRSFNDLNRVEIAWLCDADESKLKALQHKYPNAKVTTKVQDIWSDPEIEAVSISTPVASHYDLASAAIAAGKHVLIEKPITMKSSEAVALIKQAEEKQRILMVGQIFEYNESIIRLKKFIQSGELGEIYYLNFTRTNLGPVRTDVNSLFDLITHDISIMCDLFDTVPNDVSSNGSIYLNQGLEDVVFANYRFDNNIMVNVHASWLNPRKERKIVVVGSRKMAVWDDLDLKNPIIIYDKHVESNQPDDSFLGYKSTCVDGGVFIPRVPMSQPLINECAHFIDCIENNERPKSDGYSGYRVMRVLEATMDSLQKDGARSPITLDMPRQTSRRPSGARQVETGLF